MVRSGIPDMITEKRFVGYKPFNMHDSFCLEESIKKGIITK